MSNQTPSAAKSHDVLRVELGARSYDILVGSNLLADTAGHIAPLVKKVSSL